MRKNRKMDVLLIEGSELLRTFYTNAKILMEDESESDITIHDHDGGMEALMTRKYDVVVISWNSGSHLPTIERMRALQSTAFVVITTGGLIENVHERCSHCMPDAVINGIYRWQDIIHFIKSTRTSKVQVNTKPKESTFPKVLVFWVFAAMVVIVFFNKFIEPKVTIVLVVTISIFLIIFLVCILVHSLRSLGRLLFWDKDEK